jgi:hypothetical protein
VTAETAQTAEATDTAETAQVTGATGAAAGDSPPDRADEPAPARQRGTATPAETVRTVHRLRDLDRRGRVSAALFALALLLAPALAFAWAAPDWMPANDPALMAVRALDVGTSRTPLTGQPSTSAHYIAAERHVDHPGALHYYLLAAPVRVFGTAAGMLIVSVAITGGCVLLAAWAIFRQLGLGAGALAAVVLGAVTFTTGAASLVNPVSSNIAGYPLLCSMVLLWCLVCGDVRLLALATAVVSFAAQQHLSVLPALGVATVAALAAGLVAWGRAGRWRARADRRELGVSAGISAAAGLVLWSPVLLEQVAPRGGNLTMMAEFAGDSGRPTMGLRSATYQVVNVLGLPPLLGQTDLTGAWLLERPTALTWASAATVVAALVALAVRWRRRPRRFALVVMAGIVAVAGLANGASVPEGLEKFRLALYHWAFPLALLVVLALGLGMAELVGRTPLARPSLRPVLAGCALLTVAVPALVNPSVDRPSNTLAAAYSPVDRRVVERAAEQVVEHGDRLGGDIVLLSRGGDANFDGLPDGLAAMLIERGISMQFPSTYRHFVDDERLAHRRTADAGLMVVVDDGTARTEPAGELIADQAIVEGLDLAAFEALVAQVDRGADADGVRFGPAVERALDVLPRDLIAQIEAGQLPAGVSTEELFAEGSDEVDAALGTALLLQTITDDPAARLLDSQILDFLIENPLASPRLGPELLRRLRDGLPDGWSNDPLRLSVYLLDRDELLSTATEAELP